MGTAPAGVKSAPVPIHQPPLTTVFAVVVAAIETSMVARMYKYDSGARGFKEFSHAHAFGTGTVCTTHAVVLRPQFYAAPRRYDERSLLHQ